MKQIYHFLFLAVLAGSALLAEVPALRTIHKIYLDNMDPKFEEYLRLEFSRQFRGDVEVVLDRHIADGILRGRTEQQQPRAAARTARRLGLDDVNTGFVEMLDRDQKTVLWTERAGDRNAPFGDVGSEKVAQRLVKKLKKAMR